VAEPLVTVRPVGGLPLRAHRRAWPASPTRTVTNRPVC